jgi:hypothetical protein
MPLRVSNYSAGVGRIRAESIHGMWSGDRDAVCHQPSEVSQIRPASF